MTEHVMHDHDGPLARLRTVPENPHGFRGYGPLLALGVLLLLMVLLAPTIAPEHVVLVPDDGAPSTTTTAEVAP
jgi:hypothetical protein